MLHVSCGSRHSRDLWSRTCFCRITIVCTSTTKPGKIFQDDTELTGAFSYSPAMIANRISYHLDLRGPSVPIHTACSSTLYATHIAIQALRNGECEAAVVGGAQINHRSVQHTTSIPHSTDIGVSRFAEWVSYTHGGILSPDGKCKPFDVSANGLVSSITLYISYSEHFHTGLAVVRGLSVLF